jgi:hypothetical protein
MGAAAYNRGSKIVSREADARMPATKAKADAAAHGEELRCLREQVALLERDLSRARLCLAAERMGRESLRSRLQESERAHAFGVTTLCLALRRAGVPGFTD